MDHVKNNSAGRGGPLKSQEDWARIWFAQLARFHRVRHPQRWQFTQQQVINFLRSKLAAGVPAWKRLKIVEGVIVYLDRIRRSQEPRLEPIGD